MHKKERQLNHLPKKAASATTSKRFGARKMSPETEGRSYDAQRPGAKEDAENLQSQIPNPKSENGRMIVSPIAARMAAENGVDLKSLKGSGPNGRIIQTRH